MSSSASSFFKSHAMFALFAAGILALAGCGSTSPPAPNAPASTSTASTSNNETALFVDGAAKAGLSWKHELGDKGRFYFIESTPPGCAFLDYNNDGFDDVFLVQSGSPAPKAGEKGPFGALYRNNRDGTFTDVTSGSGLDRDFGYGHGAAIADFDNDGFSDIFLTAYGGNHLLRNLGGSGKFADVTQQLGLAKPDSKGYATSAAWGDFGNDGRLDLYVCYYAKWTPQTDKICKGSDGILDYCSPLVYLAAQHHLFQNTLRGFVDVSKSSGIASELGRGLAVSWLDFNGDGRQDIFVANDLTPNMLWQNLGNGRFKDVAVETGCAFGDENKAMSGMGIAVADYNRSGRPSLYVSNFSGRPNALFKNGGNYFEESSGAANLVASHVNLLSFGCEFLDYDADGWPDLITNNGHVQTAAARREAGVPQAQRKQLLHNRGDGTFQEISGDKAGDLNEPRIGRGLAVGDYDNDGSIDVLAVNQNSGAQLFHNQRRNGNHWISFQTRGIKSNRDGLHTRFVMTIGKARQTAIVRAGSSYLSSSDRRVYFGLENATSIDKIEIFWPSGTRETVKNVQPDRFYLATEGHGLKAINFR